MHKPVKQNHKENINQELTQNIETLNRIVKDFTSLFT